MSLYQRFFVDPLVADQEVNEAETIERVKARALVDQPYFKEVMDRLREMQEQNDPLPGAPEKMLYQCGVRDGIKLVRQYFEALEGSVQ